MKTFEIKTLVTVDDDIDEWNPAIKDYYLGSLAAGADHNSLDFAKSLFVRAAIDGLGFWTQVAHPYLQTVVRVFTMEMVEKPEGATGWYAPGNDGMDEVETCEDAHKRYRERHGETDEEQLPVLDMAEFEQFLAQQREKNEG